MGSEVVSNTFLIVDVDWLFPAEAINKKMITKMRCFNFKILQI